MENASFVWSGDENDLRAWLARTSAVIRVQSDGSVHITGADGLTVSVEVGDEIRWNEALARFAVYDIN